MLARADQLQLARLPPVRAEIHPRYTRDQPERTRRWCDDLTRAPAEMPPRCRRDGINLARAAQIRRDVPARRMPGQQQLQVRGWLAEDPPELVQRVRPRLLLQRCVVGLRRGRQPRCARPSVHRRARYRPRRPPARERPASRPTSPSAPHLGRFIRCSSSNLRRVRRELPGQLQVHRVQLRGSILRARMPK